MIKQLRPEVKACAELNPGPSATPGDTTLTDGRGDTEVIPE